MCVDLVFLHLHLVSIGWMEDLGIWVSVHLHLVSIGWMEDLGIWVSGTLITQRNGRSGGMMFNQWQLRNE